MANYYVGNRLHIESPDDPQAGIPVVGSDGQEIYVMPEDFDHQGRPESDIMHWKPDDSSGSELLASPLSPGLERRLRERQALRRQMEEGEL